MPPELLDLGSLQIFNLARLLRATIASMGSELGLTADSTPRPRINGVGIWWICWTATWTVLLLWGMAFLIHHRQMSMLKIRGIWLSLSSILFLHLYWASVQLGYVFGPLYPGDMQYWIMGTYLPLGIGLFHASNTRFLHVAQRQKQFVDKADIPNIPNSYKPSKAGGILGRFRELDYSAKAVILVSSGMFFQVSSAYPRILTRRAMFIKFYTPRANNLLRSYSWQFSCTSSPGNGIVLGASQVPRFLGLRWSRKLRWAEAGSGEFSN